MSDIAETESTALAEHNTAAENQNAAAPASCNECGRTYESKDTHNQLWHVKKTTVHFSDDTKVIVHRDSDSGRFVCPRGNIAEQNSQQFTRHGPKSGPDIPTSTSPAADPALYGRTADYNLTGLDRSSDVPKHPIIPESLREDESLDLPLYLRDPDANVVLY
ncbi:hypothetical protein C8J57DRAFT_1506979 [Mycena rebaudengoi]|nr:hypothetical protein C8J57DRAFT_1506979 [Mycena rebaudengoi]